MSMEKNLNDPVRSSIDRSLLKEANLSRASFIFSFLSLLGISIFKLFSLIDPILWFFDVLMRFLNDEVRFVLFVISIIILAPLVFLLIDMLIVAITSDEYLKNAKLENSHGKDRTEPNHLKQQFSKNRALISPENPYGCPLLEALRVKSSVSEDEKLEVAGTIGPGKRQDVKPINW